MPTCASSTRGSVPCRPFTTTVGLWFASPTVLIVQSIRAAKSCWNAARHRQIVAWSEVYDFPSTPVHRVAGAVVPRVRVAPLGPEGARLAVGLAPHVPPAPSAVGRAHGAREPVVHEAQERGRVPLVDAAREGIERPERSLAPHVRVHPLVGERREVRPRRVAVEPVAADARPGGEVVLLAVLRGRCRDVAQARELAADPRAGVVLVGDRVDAQLGDQGLDLRRRSRGPRGGERLSERVGAAPGEDPQRPWVVPLGRAQDQLGPGRRLPLAHGRHPVGRLSRAPPRPAAPPPWGSRGRASAGSAAPSRRRRGPRG